MYVNVGSYQLANKKYDVEEIAQYLVKADEQELDVILFPEGFINGYTRDKTEAMSLAINLSSETFLTNLLRFKDFKVTVIAGIIETEQNNLFNTAIVIHKGRLIGKYRKTHPNEEIYKAGTLYPVFTIKGVKFGINICHDANFSDAAQKLANQGAKIIFCPLNNVLDTTVANKWRTRHLDNLIARSKDTSTWVISSDVIHKDKVKIGYGCTAIISPDGVLVDRIPELTQGLISYTIPLFN